jgi:hypothetical protein
MIAPCTNAVNLVIYFKVPPFTMNSFYLANDMVVIDRPACTLYFHPRDRKRKRGGISKIVNSGSAGSFDPLFKTVLTTDQNKKRGGNFENTRTRSVFCQIPYLNFIV